MKRPKWFCHTHMSPLWHGPRGILYGLADLITGLIAILTLGNVYLQLWTVIMRWELDHWKGSR